MFDSFAICPCLQVGISVHKLTKSGASKYTAAEARLIRQVGLGHGLFVGHWVAV